MKQPRTLLVEMTVAVLTTMAVLIFLCARYGLRDSSLAFLILTAAQEAGLCYLHCKDVKVVQFRGGKGRTQVGFLNATVWHFAST